MSAQVSWEAPAIDQVLTEPHEGMRLVPPTEVVGAVASVATATEVRAPEPRGTTSIDHYLHDIGMTPLLTREEEIELGTRIQAGIAAEEQMTAIVEQEGEPDAAVQQALEQLQTDGQAATDQMVRANLRLVVWEAKKWINRGGSLKLGDLIQAGNLGLMHAVELYDPTVGTKLNTYAVPWIRQFIQREIDNTGRMVRFPVGAEEARRSYRKFREDWEKKHGEMPGEDDFLEQASDSMTENDYELAMNIDGTQPTVSLDQPLDTEDSDSATVGDRIAGTDAGETYKVDLRVNGILSELADVLYTADVPTIDKVFFSLQKGIYIPQFEGKEIAYRDNEQVTYSKALVAEGGMSLGNVADIFGSHIDTVRRRSTGTRKAMLAIYEERGGSAFL